MVGGRCNKNLPSITWHFIRPVFLRLPYRPNVALVGIICCDCDIFYRATGTRKIILGRAVAAVIAAREIGAGR